MGIWQCKLLLGFMVQVSDHEELLYEAKGQGTLEHC